VNMFVNQDTEEDEKVGWKISKDMINSEWSGKNLTLKQRKPSQQYLSSKDDVIEEKEIEDSP